MILFGLEDVQMYGWPLTQGTYYLCEICSKNWMLRAKGRRGKVRVRVIFWASREFTLGMLA